MQKYERPQLEIIIFENEDVITASGGSIESDAYELPIM